MSTNVTIEVDKRTAEVLETRAAELGLTVPQLIAELRYSTALPGKRTPRRLQSSIAGMPTPRKVRVCLTTA